MTTIPTPVSIENHLLDFFTISYINNNSKTLEELLALGQKALQFIERNQASGHPFQIDDKRLQNLFDRFAVHYHSQPSYNQEEQDKKMDLIRIEQSMAWFLDLQEARNFPTYLQQFEAYCGDERILGFLSLFYKRFCSILENHSTSLQHWSHFFTPYLYYIAYNKFNFEKIFKFHCGSSLKKMFYNGRIQLNDYLSELDIDLSFPSVSFEDSFIELFNLRQQLMRKAQKRDSFFYKTLGQISYLLHLVSFFLEKDKKVFQLMYIWTTIYFEKIKTYYLKNEDQIIYFPFEKMTVDPKCWIGFLRKSCEFLSENSLESNEILDKFAVIESCLYLIFTNKLNEIELLNVCLMEGDGTLLLKIINVVHTNKEILQESKSLISGSYGDLYQSLVWILLQLTKHLLTIAKDQKQHQNTLVYKLINLAPSLQTLKPLIAQSYFNLIKSFAVQNKVIRKWLKVNCNFFSMILDQYLGENKNDALALHLGTLVVSFRELLSSDDPRENTFVLCQKKLAKVYKAFLKQLSLTNNKNSSQLQIMGFFLMEILDLSKSSKDFPQKKKLKFLLEFFSFMQKYRQLETWDFYLLDKHLGKILEAYPEFKEMIVDELLIKIMLIHKKEALSIPLEALTNLTFIDRIVMHEGSLKQKLCCQLNYILGLENEIDSILKQHGYYTYNLLHHKRNDVLAKQDIKTSLQKFIYHTLQWTCKYLTTFDANTEKDVNNFSQILNQINLFLFNPDLFILLESRDEQAICFFYENAFQANKTAGLVGVKMLYKKMIEGLSSGCSVGRFKLLAQILSKINLLAFIDDDLKDQSSEVYNALALYIIGNLQNLGQDIHDLLIGLRHLAESFNSFGELLESAISKFCSDLLNHFKVNSEEINSRYLLNIVANIFQGFDEAFFSVVIKDLDLWTLLIQKIERALSKTQKEQKQYLPEVISINNFFSFSLKVLQTGSKDDPTQRQALESLFCRLEIDIKLLCPKKLCSVGCKIIIQTVLNLSNIFDNLKESKEDSANLLLKITVNALGNKYNIAHEKLVRECPPQSFLLCLNNFISGIIESYPSDINIYNQTIIFHALRDLLQRFLQDSESAKLITKKLLHDVYQAAVTLFKELTKQNLQQMNKEYSLISKADYLVLMNEVIENTTKSMLTCEYSDDDDKSAQLAEFIVSWITLVFKFYNKISPDYKILGDKPELIKNILDLIQLAVNINSSSAQQLILSNTLLIQEFLVLYENVPLEAFFVNALAFTFDAFARHSISNQIVVEMRLKQILIVKDTIKLSQLTQDPQFVFAVIQHCQVKLEKIPNDYLVSLDPLLEQKPSLSRKIQAIFNNTNPNIKIIFGILTETLINNHLYNMVQAQKQAQPSKSLKFRNTTPLFLIISSLITRYPHLAAYLWLHKRDYRPLLEKYPKLVSDDLKVFASVTFVDCLLQVGYFDMHDHDIKVLVKALCIPLGVIFIDQETCLDVSYLVIFQVLNSSIHFAQQFDSKFPECFIKLHTILRFFALLSCEIEQSLPKQLYKKYYSPRLSLGINKILAWWMALDRKILKETYSPIERQTVCSLISCFLKNYVKRKLSMSSLKQNVIQNFKFDHYIYLISDTKTIQNQKRFDSYFQNVSQKIDQDLQILSKITPKLPNKGNSDKNPLQNKESIKRLEVPVCTNITVFGDSPSKDLQLKLDFLHLRDPNSSSSSNKFKSKLAEKKPRFNGLELYLKANNQEIYTNYLQFGFQPSFSIEKNSESPPMNPVALKVHYFFHQTIQSELELSNIQQRLIFRLKLLSEQISLKLGRFGSTAVQLDGSKDLISQELKIHLDSLPSFEKNLTLCFLQEFTIFDLFELPNDIDEIKKEYHWIKRDFSSYLQTLNQLRTLPKGEDSAFSTSADSDFGCFNFTSESSIIPSPNNQTSMPEEQIKVLQELLIIDDDTFLSVITEFFSSSSKITADIIQQLLQSANFEAKLMDYCIFYLYSPFTLISKSPEIFEIQATDLGCERTQNLSSRILDFFQDHLKIRDYLLVQHRSVFELSRLKLLAESPLNETFQQKTNGLISFADLLINLADKSSPLKNESWLKSKLDSAIKEICLKLENFIVSRESENNQIFPFQIRIITQKSCKILLLFGSHFSSSEIQLVRLSSGIDALQSRLEANGTALKFFNNKVFFADQKSDLEEEHPKSLKDTQMRLETLESSFVDISILFSNWKPDDPNDKLYIQIIQEVHEKILNTAVFKEFFVNLFLLAEYISQGKRSHSEQGESLITCLIKLCFHFYTLIHVHEKFAKASSRVNPIGLSSVEITQTSKEKIDPLSFNFDLLKELAKNTPFQIDFKLLFVNLCIKYQDPLSKLFLDSDCSDELLSEFKVIQKPLRSVFDFSTKKKIFIQAIDTFFKKSGVPESSRTIIIDRNDLLRSTLSQFRGLTTNELRETVKIIFENESGIDAGGLSREWYSLIAEEIFNPRNGIFSLSNNQTLLQPNPSALAIPFHLQYLELAGIIIAKAILRGCVVGVNLTRSFLKHILQRNIALEDLYDLDADLTKSLEWILENPVENLEQPFTFQSEYFGQKMDRELILNGNNFVMNEENKKIFIKKVCELKMRDEISEEIKAFTRGFHIIIPPNFLQFLEVDELGLMISGVSSIDVDEMKKYAIMRNFTETDSELINWIWDVLNQFSLKDLTAFLVFISGSSRMQFGGFKENPLRFEKVEGDFNRLPVAHTCFRSVEIFPYKSKESLKQKLLYAIYEGKQGFMII